MVSHILGYILGDPGANQGQTRGHPGATQGEPGANQGRPTGDPRAIHGHYDCVTQNVLKMGLILDGVSQATTTTNYP
jgi:hypothetical protein